MAFTSKKLLSSLALASMVSMTAANVVACGFTLDRIIEREQRTNVLNNTFAYSVTSWNTAYTMQAEDQKVLANVFATPLARDEYQRTYGDIFESNEDLSSDLVGQTNDSITWNYTIRKNAVWTNPENTAEKENIKFGDFWNAAEFVLKSSITGSQTSSLWKSFIVGAEEIASFYDQKDENGNNLNGHYSLEEAIEKIRETNSNFVFGLSSGSQNARDMNSDKVTFTLIKPAPYFESLLCYSVFSPIHETARKNHVPNFKDTWYSGAYIPTKVNGISMMTLEKNENYHFKEKATIDKINYKFLSKAGAGAARTLFESGDTTGFTVSSADAAGWKRYIGDDLDNPAFNQMYDVPSLDATSTFVMYFNSYNSRMDEPGADSKYQSASKLLQSKAARQFIATNLDRSQFVKYYSEKFDGGSETSKMIRNLFTAPGMAAVGTKEYYDYAEEALLDLAKTNQGTLTEDDLNLADGNEMLLGKSEWYTGDTNETLIKEIQDFIKENNLKTTGGKVQLEYLTNPEHNSTLNPAIGRMFTKFNSIANNPIQIVVTEATSESDYNALKTAGKFDLFNGGWGPDFADPSTFLATTTIGGDLDSYTGTMKSIVSNGTSNEIIDKLETSESAEFVEAYQNYTDNFKETDVNVTSDMNQRLTEFAQEEVKFLYEDFLMIPFYTRAAPKNYQVSHVMPYTASYDNMYGVSAYKEFTKKISKTLPTAEQLKEATEYWQNYLKFIEEDENKGKDDNIFWDINKNYN
ncbi:ABC transporter substrate-binding protein [Spiroplasma culicicola]|uniref:Oligopeptide ABC transporter substrate-binding protein n=1 Tax=Spiroplasma culicicola AES-1 TaxID=1276246 RepID=W6A800_9MOLU|nr:ABC transporter substrate-binding protein [Spiroplasma culicicola]AHI53116.1 oligopeptide ABC transporter substrate-binding protein [Spiroplasma culicicola AES-1]